MSGRRRKIFSTSWTKNLILPWIRAPFRITPSARNITHRRKTAWRNRGGEQVFCNPPYGRKIYDWVRKAYNESKKPGTTVVMLIPARTDTRYFHDFIYHQAKEIRFIKGRLKFGNAKNAAPFPSMIVIF